MKNNILQMKIELALNRDDILDLLMENMNNQPFDFKDISVVYPKGRNKMNDYFYKERLPQEADLENYTPSKRGDKEKENPDPFEQLLPIKVDLHIESLTDFQSALTLKLIAPEKKDATRNKASVTLMNMLLWRIFDRLLRNLTDRS